MSSHLRKILVLSLFFLLINPTLLQAEDSWPQYQGGANHRGYSKVSLNPNKLTLRWEKTLGTLPLHPPTTSANKVFVSQDGYFGTQSLFALRERDGNTIWQHDFNDLFSVNPPAFSDGMVFLQTGKNVTTSVPPYLHAFNSNTGALVFQSQFSAQWEEYLAPTIDDGTVFVNGGYYGGMYAFDALNGSQKWFTSLSQYDEWTPAVDEEFAYSYVGGELQILNRETGQIVNSISDPNFQWAGWSMRSAPIRGNRRDVIARNEDRLISFDLASSTVAWERNGGYTGQPALRKGRIYAVAQNTLEVLDQSTGSVIWTWTGPLGNSLVGEVVVSNSHVFVSTDIETYAVSISSGQTAWSYPRGGHLALTDDTLYIAGASGTLTALGKSRCAITIEDAALLYGK